MLINAVIGSIRFPSMSRDFDEFLLMLLTGILEKVQVVLVEISWSLSASIHASNLH